jgi:hypothetical protein
MYSTPRQVAGAALLLGLGLALSQVPVQAQTTRYAAADSADSPDNSAHALDALSSAAKQPQAAGEVSKSQLAAVQSRLDSFMRLSSASSEDNRAALAELRARVDALAQQLNRQQQSRGEDPRLEALAKRLDDDERLIAQLRSGQAQAAARPAAPAPVAAAPVTASGAKVSCSDLSAGSDSAWSAAVALAYPGYALDSVDVGEGSVYVHKSGNSPELASVDRVKHAVGCS